EDVLQAPAATHRNEGQRAKHLGVVGHDAANAYAEVAVVARRMVKERRRTTLALVGEHFGESHPRTIVDRHEGRFPACASDVVLQIASDAVSGPLNARELLAVDVQQFARSSSLVAPWQRCRIKGGQTAQAGA